jgi:death-on-curing protein
LTEPLWLKREWVDAIHFKQLQRFGGQYGIRDENVIESAVARPRHKWLYEGERDLAVPAAAYAYGLARNHGYTDGNKRVAIAAAGVFLAVNGRRLMADEADVVRVMNAVAAGELSEAAFAEWMRAHTVEK